MPQRQQGQSLLVLVVLLGALLSALWWTTEAGSAVNEKQRLANAADAAALSAAVWQALAAAAALAARPDLLDITYRSTESTRVDAATALETWELEVRWCRELFFAPIKYVIPALLQMRSTFWFDEACYARESLPLVAKAYVLRPSAPQESQGL
jgi:hypothetical protein